MTKIGQKSGCDRAENGRETGGTEETNMEEQNKKEIEQLSEASAAEELTEQTEQVEDGSKFELNFDEDAFDQSDILAEEEQAVHNAEPQKKKRKKKKAGPMVFVFYTVAIIGVSVLLAAGIWIGLNDVFAFNKSSKTVQVEIERDSTTKEIAEVLKENGLIEFPLLFRFVSKMSEYDDKYQYGIYTLRTDMGYDSLMVELQKNAPKKDVVKLTVVEGMTLREIAALLEENEICEADAFVETVNKADFGYRFEDKLEHDPLKFYRMEGYVFPDT
ncbi:MAG: endolytic transglycosylase MltG, partial [Oscillospiraceae bacterium]|nr:endolytic transglycosylase MltG [Oscillospiraceae bacterium]